MISFSSMVGVSLIIPTFERHKSLSTTLESLAIQSVQPMEIIIVDSSKVFDDKLYKNIKGLNSKIVHLKAEIKGAAAQRNQGIDHSTQKIIGFSDDDVILEPNCFNLIWDGINNNEKCGGISAMITNQKYHSPGKLSKYLFAFLNGKNEKSYAGKCFGPAICQLPDDQPELPNYQQVNWLNLGCTLYRKEALPNPVFDVHFTGYSLMEDVALSLRVSKKWELLNARTARLYHDSQSGTDKKNIKIFSEMELVNRFYIIKNILNAPTPNIYLKLFVLELFMSIASKNFLKLDYWRGKVSGIRKIQKI